MIDLAVQSRFPPPLASDRSCIWAFGDDGGAFKSRPYFVVGIVRSNDPERHERDLQDIAASHRLECAELKYAQTNRLFQYAKQEIIHYFFTTPGLNYQCLVKPREFHNLRYYVNSMGIPKQDMAHNHSWKTLLTYRVNKWDDCHFVVDERSRSARDDFPGYLQEHVAQVRTVECADSASLRLLQLADLLNGALYGNLTGVKQPMKADIWHTVRRLGDVYDFAHNRHDLKYGIWHWRPPGQ